MIMETPMNETLEAVLTEALKTLNTLTGQYPGIDTNHYFCATKNRIETALKFSAIPNLDTSDPVLNDEDRPLVEAIAKAANG